MASIVLDTSVLVKWFVDDEPLTERALAIRASLVSGEVDALVPVHLPIELAAALVRSMRRGRLAASDIPEALEAIRSFEIETADVVGGSRLATDLAVAAGIHPADALFIVAAQKRRAILVTADRRLLEVARSVGCDAYGLHELGAVAPDV